jgi:hypothetical protein
MRVKKHFGKLGAKSRVVRNTHELAQEFGVKVEVLRGYFGKCPEGRPLPISVHGSSYSGFKTYYELKQARTWWATVCEKHRNPERT